MLCWFILVLYLGFCLKGPVYTQAGVPKNVTSTVPIWAKLLCHLLVHYRDFGCAQQIIQLKFYVSHRHRDSMNQLSYELRYRQSFQRHIAPKKLFWSVQKQILKFHCTVEMFLFKKVMVSLFVGSISGDYFRNKSELKFHLHSNLEIIELFINLF